MGFGSTYDSFLAHWLVVVDRVDSCLSDSLIDDQYMSGTYILYVLRGILRYGSLLIRQCAHPRVRYVCMYLGRDEITHSYLAECLASLPLKGRVRST